MECAISTERKDMVPKSKLRLWTVFIIAHIQNMNEMMVNNILKYLRCCCGDDEGDDVIIAIRR